MKFTAVAIVLLVAVVAINAVPLGDSNYNRNVNNNNNNNQDRLYSSLYNQLIAQQSGKAGPEVDASVAEDDVPADDDAADGEAKNADGSKSHNPYHPSSNYNYNSNNNNNQNIIDSFLLSQLYSQLINNQGTHGHGIH